MSKNKFVGIAYWTVNTTEPMWLGKAAQLLCALEKAALATVKFEPLPAGEQMTVSFGNETHQMLVAEGKGRGVVRAAPSSPLFVVCLVALRKVLGGIEVVTDSQETVPSLPRQNHPLYADAWPRVLPIAQELGLATGAAFMSRNANTLNAVF